MSKREREEEFIALDASSDRKAKKQKKSKDDDGKPRKPQKSLIEFKEARKEKKLLKQAAKRERRLKPRRQGPKNLEKYGSTKEQKAARKLAKKEAAELREARLAAKAAANGEVPKQEGDSTVDEQKRQKEAAAAAAAGAAADSKRRRDEDKAAKKARKEARRAKKRAEEQEVVVEEAGGAELGFVVDLEGDAEIAQQAEARGTSQEETKKLSKRERKALKNAEKSESAVNGEANGRAPDVAIVKDDVEDKMEIEPQVDIPAKKVKKEKSQKLDGGDKMEIEPQLDVPAKKEKKEKTKKSKSNGDITTTPVVDEQASDVSSGYNEHAELTALPQSDITAFLESKQITVSNSGKARRPITLFKYLPITEEQRVPFKGFTSPTPIQAAAWPYLLDGRDVIGVAETGSGKTLAFGVPCIRRLSALDKASRKYIRACIVSPTRELALQIQEQLAKFTAPFGLKVTCVYGGVDKDAQRRELKGTQIVVATPGRLNDFIGDGSIDLSHVDYMVLDEADRMLDKGFEEEVRKIVSSTAATGRQTLMFTATWPPSVRDLASTFMSNPVRINIGDNTTGELRANTRIVQEVEVMDPREKQDRLIQLLKQYQSGKNKSDKILVFCLYKKEATRIEEFIRRKGFNVAGIHGDLNQHQRTESLESFKQGRVPLLVATDVAARGLDIPAVKLVINVTFPLTAEDYVHRIGRTGRAGQDGKAITFFTDEEKGLAGALINVLKAANQSVPEALLKYGTTVKKKSHDVYGAFYKDTSDMKASTKITFD